jgi:ubiquinone/menaquinone biosynthesis C-methylase UbiE
MELRFILNLSEKSGRTLDIGCGDKRFTKHLSDAVGIDPFPKYDVIVNKPDIVASGTCLPFRDETFDSIHAHSVLEHIQDVSKVIRECYRVLKPNGSMIVISPHDLQWAIIRFFTFRIHDLLRDKGHCHKLCGEKILNYTKNHFRLEKIVYMPTRIFPLYTGVRLRRL